MTVIIERRTLAQPVEFRSEGGKLVAAGYAAVFNKLSQNLGGFVEQVAPGAFTKTIQEQDVRGLFNHDASALLGRSGAGTLRLEEDGTGLHYEIDLPDTTVGRDVAALLERGDITGSSFGFRTIDDEWGETPDGFPLRTLRQVSARDVGPVTFPAYLDTTSALRSLAEARALDPDALAAAVAAGRLVEVLSRSVDDDGREPLTVEVIRRPRDF